MYGLLSNVGSVPGGIAGYVKGLEGVGGTAVWLVVALATAGESSAAFYMAGARVRKEVR